MVPLKQKMKKQNWTSLIQEVLEGAKFLLLLYLIAGALFWPPEIVKRYQEPEQPSVAVVEPRIAPGTPVSSEEDPEAVLIPEPEKSE